MSRQGSQTQQQQLFLFSLFTGHLCKYFLEQRTVHSRWSLKSLKFWTWVVPKCKLCSVSGKASKGTTGQHLKHLNNYLENKFSGKLLQQTNWLDQSNVPTFSEEAISLHRETGAWYPGKSFLCHIIVGKGRKAIYTEVLWVQGLNDT